MTQVLEEPKVYPHSVTSIKGHTVILHQLTIDSGRCYYLIKQISDLFLDHQFQPRRLANRAQFHAPASSDPLKKISPATRAEVCQKEGSCLDNRGPAPLCCSSALIIRTLAREGYNKEWLGQLLLSTPSSASTPQLAPPCPTAPTTTPENTTATSFGQAMAIMLDNNAVQLPLYATLSLQQVNPALLQNAELQRQQQLFEEYCKHQVFIGRDTGKISDSTYKLTQREISQFLGYCHLHMKVSSPTLLHATNVVMLGHYFSSRHKSGLQGGTLSKGAQALRRVVAWWKLQPEMQGNGSVLAHVHSQLSNLDKQFQKMPKLSQDIHDLQQQGQAPSAGELVRTFVAQHDRVLASLGNVPSLSVEQARDVHEVFMACLMYGYVPPVRPCVIMTLIGPTTFVNCPHPDCHFSNCSGNTIRYVLGSDTYHFHVPHHKTQLSHHALDFDLPEDLVQLARLYFDRAYPALVADRTSNSHPFMFMNMTGGAISDGRLSQLFKCMLDKWGLARIAPRLMRHIFVDEVQSQDASPDFVAGAAHVMGNSQNQWIRSYDLKRGRRYAQHAIEQFKKLRVAYLHDGDNVQVQL